LFIVSASLLPFPVIRGLVTVSGTDAFAFLQNILTNDLSLLDSCEFLHACLLTPQGKYLHDFFVSRHGDSYFLNCESGARADDLARRLSLYKLRADVTISVAELPPAPDALPFDDWDAQRIRAALPDGARDAEIGVSSLAELNLDMVAVSYTKGCYVGQELVARMHNRNLGKKHLVAVAFINIPPSHGTDIEHFGQMRSSCGHMGLILMPREIEDNLKQGLIENAPFRLLGL
jgi:tRNA-modifying protein YgfZ